MQIEHFLIGAAITYCSGFTEKTAAHVTAFRLFISICSSIQRFRKF